MLYNLHPAFLPALTEGRLQILRSEIKEILFIMGHGNRSRPVFCDFFAALCSLFPNEIPHRPHPGFYTGINTVQP